jgi:hypothetical protein
LGAAIFCNWTLKTPLELLPLRSANMSACASTSTTDRLLSFLLDLVILRVASVTAMASSVGASAASFARTHSCGLKSV